MNEYFPYRIHYCVGVNSLNVKDPSLVELRLDNITLVANISDYIDLEFWNGSSPHQHMSVSGEKCNFCKDNGYIIATNFKALPIDALMRWDRWHAITRTILEQIHLGHMVWSLCHNALKANVEKNIFVAENELCSWDLSTLHILLNDLLNDLPQNR